MKAYTNLYDDVLPELPGIEVTLALHHIKRACQDFCSRSAFSRVTLPAINVTTSLATYSLAHPDPTNFEITKILVVEYEGRRMTPKTIEWMNDTPNDWNRNTGDATLYSWRTQTGNPRFYIQQAIASLTLVAVPNHDTLSGLLVTISDQPSYTGVGINDDTWSAFAEDIGAGAKSRLMKMPNKPWSNAQAGHDYWVQFENAIGAAATMASKGYGRATLRTKAWG